jgi:hypothetical protein
MASLITLQVGPLEVSAHAWRSILSSALSAVIVTAYNWLDVTDTRYGRGHE